MIYGISDINIFSNFKITINHYIILINLQYFPNIYKV